MGIFNLFSKRQKEPNSNSQLPDGLAELFLSSIKSNPQACSLDEIPQGYGKFGLEESNPIPVCGVPSNETYLTSLALNDNSSIRWRRVGSTGTSNIDCPIDKYEIFDFNGDTVCFLYISPYHWKISQKCPDGFKFK